MSFITAIATLLAVRHALSGCDGGGNTGCINPTGTKWNRWDMAGSTYTYCFGACPIEWLWSHTGNLTLGEFGGVVGVDHYYTKQGMPCVNGKPQEFEMQAALATRWKSRFPSMRFLSYRILSAVPYDMVVQNKIISDPDYFVRWTHGEPSAATKKDQKCPPGGCQANSVCYNYISACFNDPKRINSPAHNCSFQIRAASYNWAKPEVSAWYIDNIIAPTTRPPFDGAWLDGNGPDNGAYMCGGICCGFGATNSPQNQSEIDSFCAGEKAVANAIHQYLAAHDAAEYNCFQFLSPPHAPLPQAGQDAAECSANLQKLASFAGSKEYSMPVVYGDRTSAKGYDASSAPGAVAAFLLARGPRWLFHMPNTNDFNNDAGFAALMLSDYGRPVGDMDEVPGRPNVWAREYEKATIQLDCDTFTATFTPKVTDGVDD